MDRRWCLNAHPSWVLRNVSSEANWYVCQTSYPGKITWGDNRTGKGSHRSSNRHSTREERKRCPVLTAPILLPQVVTIPAFVFGQPVLSYLHPWDSGDISSTCSSRDDIYHPSQKQSGLANLESKRSYSPILTRRVGEKEVLPQLLKTQTVNLGLSGPILTPQRQRSLLVVIRF